MPNPTFNLKVVTRIIADIHEELQREANQSILKKDHAQGLAALGGIDALQRLEHRISMVRLDYRFVEQSEKSQPHRKLKISPIRGTHS